MFPLQPVGNVSYFWFHAQCFSGESVRVLIIIVLLFHYYLWANSTPDSASYRTHSYCSIVFTVPKWPECHSHVEVMRVCCHVTPPDPLVGSAVCQIITAAQFHHYSWVGRFTFRPPGRVHLLEKPDILQQRLQEILQIGISNSLAKCS